MIAADRAETNSGSRCATAEVRWSTMLPLTQRQSRRRRHALIATGVISVAVLVAAFVIPIWDADAGGLERGETTRRFEPGRERREPRALRNEPGRERTLPPSSPPSTGAGSEPVAIPLVRDRMPNGRLAAPPAPSRPTTPSRVPLPPLPPPDPKLADVLPAETVQLTGLKRLFRRPAPQNLRGTDKEIAKLGERLFSEKKLSADHRMSCATCHDPAQGFADGRRKARGNRGQDLARNTPALWNLADARAFYWDGRAATLEAQIKDAIEREGEMDATLEAGVVWLNRDPNYVELFRRVFSTTSAVTPDNVLKALAAYERTLVSPETRFDRFVDGDTYALTERELAGFRLFTGKGRCLACHGGWRLTDDLFHDIGLRSDDPGRRGVSVDAPERAFKTPSLRETAWTGPFMHDGSLRTLDDVVAHYAGKLEPRASLAPELKRGINLSDAERADLVGFLRTLSSDRLPRAPQP